MQARRRGARLVSANAIEKGNPKGERQVREGVLEFGYGA